MIKGKWVFWAVLGLAAAEYASAQDLVLTEGPVKNRLYARNRTTHICTVPVKGPLPPGADKVVLKVYKNEALQAADSTTGAGNFSFSTSLAAGLHNYRFELAASAGGAPSSALSVDSVACGDAYLVYGQSNAEALPGSANYPYRNSWIRTYRNGWKQTRSSEIGVWPVHLARQIVEKQKLPVCIINGAIGNTSVLELSPQYEIAATNTAWLAATKGYGNFYRRLKGWTTEAGLMGSIPALIYHQGEKQAYSSKPEDHPSHYRKDFLALRDSLYKDFPGLNRITLFQVRGGCGGGTLKWNILFEAQRQLAVELPDADIMSTWADNIIGCHYGEHDLPGYLTIGEWIYPKLDSAYYGGRYDRPLSPPDLKQAAYTSSKKDEIVLIFDQNMTWTDSMPFDSSNKAHIPWFVEGKRTTTYLRSLFHMDSTIGGQVASGSSQGNKVFLKLKAPGSWTRIAYPPYNLNGAFPGPFLSGTQSKLGALGFYVPIAAEPGPIAVGPRGGGKTRGLRVRLRGTSVFLELPDGFSRGEGATVEIIDISGRRVYRALRLPAHAGR